jgi:hypothetical protein
MFLPKRRLTSTRLYGIIYQKIEPFIVTFFACEVSAGDSFPVHRAAGTSAEVKNSGAIPALLILLFLVFLLLMFFGIAQTV